MSELKYKVGDRVRIKSIDWYNENKDNRNEITFKNNPHWRFVANQSDYCGQIATIISVSKNAYRLEHIPWNWTDEMIEGLVEEETKSKFKVGDRVITDTNMKGKIIEDVEEGWYRVEFEPHNSIPQPNGVVPEESMSLMEEKTEPKFKVGDKIKLKSTLLNDIFGVIGYESEGYRITNISNGLMYFMSYSIEHYYELVEEEVGLVDNLSSRWVNEFNLPDGYIFKDERGNEIHALKIVLEKANTLKIQSDNMETETHRGYYTTEEETTNKSKKVAWFTFGDNDFADKVELNLSNRELIQEDGKWFVVKKKREYPKTYEECCEIVKVEKKDTLEGEII